MDAPSSCEQCMQEWLEVSRKYAGSHFSQYYSMAQEWQPSGQLYSILNPDMS